VVLHRRMPRADAIARGIQRWRTTGERR